MNIFSDLFAKLLHFFGKNKIFFNKNYFSHPNLKIFQVTLHIFKLYILIFFLFLPSHFHWRRPMQRSGMAIFAATSHFREILSRNHSLRSWGGDFRNYKSLYFCSRFDSNSTKIMTENTFLSPWRPKLVPRSSYSVTRMSWAMKI